MQVMYVMKAEMGALRRALQQEGICVDAPYQKKNKEQHINGSQKSKFAGIAKKANWSKNVASRSLAPGKIPQALSDSDSEDEPHESSNMAVAERSTQIESREPKISKPESRSAEEGLTKNFRSIALPLTPSQPEMQWLRK